MAFTIDLQISMSDKIEMDKTITTIESLEGTLKDATSIIDPVILVEGDLSQFAQCNYMTIPVFGRSYFITNIRSIRNDLFEISAHVDVISTWKNEIRSNLAIVKKQQNDWNLYLNDGTFHTYQNPMVLAKPFPTGFNTQEFVLAVAGS